jgi:hypothetical protein
MSGSPRAVQDVLRQMPLMPDRIAVGDDDLIVILVGLTAGWRKRRCARRHFRRSFGERVYLPWIPYPLGLWASAAWLGSRMRRRIARGRHRRVHLVAYIGGGVLFRVLHARGECWPVGRVVWDRGPTQERVANALTARVPAFLLTLLGHRSIVDLARMDLAALPFPPSPLGAGLIVETRASVLARQLGIEEAPGRLTAEAVHAMLPGATAAIALPLSHDEVYDDARFIDQAAAFLKAGSFRTEQIEVLI